MRPHAADEPECPPDTAAIARLVAAAARGDEAAWESLVRLYGRRIYAMAKSRLHDADSAEEIAQSVFVTLASKLRGGVDAGYAESGKFEPWLFRITMNRIRDEGRRRQKIRSRVFRFTESGLSDARGSAGGAAGDALARSNDPADDHAESELDLMRNAIQTLDDRDREVIELRHHGSLSFAQIAETLSEPLGTVLARHHRAIKKLRSRMEAASTNSKSVRAASVNTRISTQSQNFSPERDTP